MHTVFLVLLGKESRKFVRQDHFLSAYLNHVLENIQNSQVVCITLSQIGADEYRELCEQQPLEGE